MNISDQTLKALEDAGYTYGFANSKNYNDDCREQADELTIIETATFRMKTIKATKKEMTIEYIMNKLNAERIYIDFANYFKKLVSAEKSNLACYPTSYGIGLSLLFNTRANLKALYSDITSKLNSLGIEYTTEYSDANWVFRFKISKSKKNIEIIKQLTA